MYNEFKTGIFIEECKNRFLCKVHIDGKIELCYISSSSKLERFIILTGREVLLCRNKGGKNKTQYTLHAVKIQDNYVLLNLGYINKLLMGEFNKSDSIYAGFKSICSEKKVVNGLKADFVIESELTTIIEAKGIITELPKAYLPSMKVERAVLQLEILSRLLSEGYCVHYYVVLMNPLTRALLLDKTNKAFYQHFTWCLNNGMKFYVYKATWDANNVSVARDTLIETEFLIEA